MRYLSLFSGMEAAHIAWSPLGWVCVAVAEIDPSACSLLGHRLNASQPKYLPAHLTRKAYAHLPPFATPGTLPNLGDVTQVTAEDIATLGGIDVAIGGSPCQDLSVAGRRAGLSGARSGLFREQLRIFRAARSLCGARWFVWENVPGAFNSNTGRDFAFVVGALAGCDLDVPADGWGNEGVALGDIGLVEWAVLDSQWFGVAQRRRRVFAVLDTGDWASRPPVLLEPESLRGDSAPRREAGKGIAGTLGARTQGGGGLGTDFEVAGGLIPEIAGCVTTGEGGRLDGESCTFIPEVAGCLNNSGGHAYPGTTLQDAIAGGFMIPEVAHTLRADGFDASEDGTGRGTPLIPVLPFDTTQITAAANGSSPKFGDPCHPHCAGAHPPVIAFGCKDSDPARGVGIGVAPTLRAMGHADSHANAGGQVAVAFAHQGGGNQTVLGYEPESGIAPTLTAGQTPAVHSAMAVRRLTPRECERLQSAPDDWTTAPNGNGRPMADGPRYKILGNSFTAAVVRWIGRRIESASKATAWGPA